MKQVYIKDTNIISPLGFSVEENFEKLLQGTTGISSVALPDPMGTIFAGKINDAVFNPFFEKIAPTYTGARIERLMIAALDSVVRNNPISPNALLIVSTTKGNIRALENGNISEADLNHSAQNVAHYFGFQRQPLIVSNACVSGVMALSIAKRFIQMHQATAVYVVAVDELTAFTVSGFQSFQAMSNEICQPFDQERKGVNLGEASVAAYLSSEKKEHSIEILGDANINDANHISGPSRTGEGLFRSITNALEEAKITADQIDFISAHGTATLYNDEMESIAFQRVGLSNTPVNSLKGYYGHTLGASGLLETVITTACMQRNVYLPSYGFSVLGVSQPMNIVTKVVHQSMNIALKTASGFGGSNSAIVLKK